MPKRTAEDLIVLNRTLLAEAEKVCALSKELRFFGAARRAGRSLDGWRDPVWGRLMARFRTEHQRQPALLAASDPLTGARDRVRGASSHALAAEERANLHRQQTADARARAEKLVIKHRSL